MRTLTLTVLLSLCLSGHASAGDITSRIAPADVPAHKQTRLGLYLSSAEAAEALSADPDIVFIDVRSRAEFQFVGHPDPVDANIPFRFLDVSTFGEGKYTMEPNKDFATDVSAWLAANGLSHSATIFVICRSGGRSAGAVNTLAAAGFRDVWNVIDGFEGGKDKASGHRTIEGWRAEGLAWTYAIAPGQAYAE